MDQDTRRDTQSVTIELPKAPVGKTWADFLPQITRADVAGLNKAQKSYGDSWKRRGGVGAFMMLARKWDRIEEALRPGDGAAQGSARMFVGTTIPCAAYDIFRAAEIDKRTEGIIDDIRDLRRYLILVLSQFKAIELGREDRLAYVSYIAEVAEEVGRRTGADRPPSRFGGIFEFMAIADLWDMLEHDVETAHYDLFKVGMGAVSLIAVNLLRIEAELLARGIVHGMHRDNLS